MRKLIVSNIVSLDGYYEGKNKSLEALFDYFHEITQVIRTSIITKPNCCVRQIP